jgi:hypothetical protein
MSKRPHKIWGLGKKRPVDMKRKRHQFGSSPTRYKNQGPPRGLAEYELSRPMDFGYTSPSGVSYHPMPTGLGGVGGLGDMTPSLATLNRAALLQIALRDARRARAKAAKE